MGDKIRQVFILHGSSHPKNLDYVWACLHHAEASIYGVRLQNQRYDHLTKNEKKLDVVFEYFFNQHIPNPDRFINLILLCQRNSHFLI